MTTGTSAIAAHKIVAESMVPMLKSLSAILDKAIAYAEAKKIDPAVLANARLAADMFPLTRQVQIASDMTKGAAARLSGQQPPKFEDNEQTLEELKARIAKTVEFAESVKAPAYEGATERRIEFPLGDKFIFKADGANYLLNWTLPNFYFHVVTAYDILRHNGLDIGKQDYMTGAAGDFVGERS